MDEETLSQSGGIEKQDESFETQDDETSTRPEVKEESESESESESDEAGGEHSEDIRPSIETEQGTDQHDLRPASAASQRSSPPSEFDYTETNSHTSSPSSRAARTTADDGSSQHEVTDEDVFSDKSPRSSLGSYDFGSESGKGHEFPDNLTSVSRSPRRSDLSSQYYSRDDDHDNDDQDFVSTIRGTPRPAFRAPSDVRTMQMSSPTQSVAGGGTSPRSNRRYVPTGSSRLGTPTGGSAQFSPKKTPDRLKPRKEAPLVLLHVTLLPLRWAWAELIGSLETADLSRDAKTLRDAWRLLQDRLGDTTCERGILLGHPQNDYEVLEERLLEALELPVRRRARILECGHYLGPANEMMMDDDDYDSDREYDDDHDDDDTRSSHHGSSRRGSRADNNNKKQHWCRTCQSDIKYESLGPRTKVFRVKVYASNGLMKAGAWAACWKEMERVDVEIEPIVEPAMQDELVRLAAGQQEREREEDEITHEVNRQFDAEKKAAAAEGDGEDAEEEEERGRSRGSRPRPRSEMHARVEDVDDDGADDFIPPPRAQEHTQPSARSSGSSSGDYTKGQHADSHAYGARHQDNSRHQKLNNASLPELVLESVRVLIQDRKNLAIMALSVFVLLLAVRTARRETLYDLGGLNLHGIVANVPEMRHVPGVEAPPPPASMQHEDVPGLETSRAVAESDAFEVRDVSGVQDGPELEEQAPKIQECPPDEDLPIPFVQETVEEAVSEAQVQTVGCIRGVPVDQASVEDTEESAVEADELPAAIVDCSTAGGIESEASDDLPEEAAAETDGASDDAYDACVRLQEQAALAASGPEDAGLFETVTQKRVVRVIQTVTQTQTQVEYVKVTATEFLPQPPAPTSSVNKGPEAIFCDRVCWEPAIVGGVEGEGEEEEPPVVEDAVDEEETEGNAAAADDDDDGLSEVDEASNPCPAVEVTA